MAGVVEAYLDAIVAHDWTRLGGTLTDNVVRTGPYFDVFEGRDAYLAFISDLMPKLANYSMSIGRIRYVDGDTHAYAEPSETLDVNGAPHTTPEVLVFDLDGDRIARIDIFIKRKG